MNITLTILNATMKNRLPFDNTYINDFKTEVLKYKYPGGIFVNNIMRENPTFAPYTFESNYQYVKTWIDAIYDTIYMTDERDIISLYLTIFYCNNQYNLSQETMTTLESYLNQTSNKQEIQYFIEELQYSYLCTALYTNNYNPTTINPLITNLKAIEQQHNEFSLTIGFKKDEH